MTYGDVADYQRATGVVLRGWECELIVELSEHFRKTAQSKVEELPPLTMDSLDRMLENIQ